MIRLRVAVAVLAVGVVAACTSSAGKAAPGPSELNGRSDSTYQGVGLTPPQPRPQFTLKDATGKTYKFGTDTAGRPTLLFFGFTNCPDVCPTTLADIANALKAVPDTIRSGTQVVFVTTDVKRDTGPVLAAYLRKFDSQLPRKFIGLYGSQAEVDAAQVAAHVTLAEDGGQTHSAQVLLYGSDDYARVSFLQSNNEADQIAHDLTLVAGIK